MENEKSKKEINIFDFDKTMIPYDSGFKFYLFCAARYPQTLLCLPYQIIGFILYGLGIYDLTKVKTPIFSYISIIPLKEAVKKFWDKHEKDVYDWAKREAGTRYSVMISASPDFLIDEIAERIKMDDHICTKHDKKGKVIGKNCHDMEKVRRFREKYPDAKVVNVFSDSIKHDKYIFSLAEHCVRVTKGGKLKPFKYKEMYKK